MEKPFVVAGAAVEADHEVPLAIQPREGSLDHPPMAAQLRLRFDAAPGDPGDDPAPATGVAAFAMIIDDQSLCRRAPSWAGAAAGRGRVSSTGEWRRACLRRADSRCDSRHSSGPRAGCLGRRPQDGVCYPPCLYLSESGRWGRPPFCRDARTIDGDAAPVDLVRPRQRFQQHTMQPSPHAAMGPLPEAAPTGRAAAAAHVGRQQWPWRSGP